MSVAISGVINKYHRNDIVMKYGIKISAGVALMEGENKASA